jgi:hypothetical protein
LSCVCAILYNVFLRYVEVDVERLLDVIDNEEIGPGVPSCVEGDIDNGSSSSAHLLRLIMYIYYDLYREIMVQNILMYFASNDPPWTLLVGFITLRIV